MGLKTFFRHGIPVGKIIKKTADLDETAEEAMDKLEARAAVMTDVVMARALGNLIDFGEVMIAAARSWYDKRIAESDK